MPTWSDLRGRRLELGIAVITLAYGITAIVGTMDFPMDARLYPIAVGVLAIPVGLAYLVSIIRGAAVSSRQTGTTAALGDAAVVDADDVAETSDAATTEESPEDTRRPPSPLLIFATTLLSIGVLALFGVYIYTVVFTLGFGRWVARLSWPKTLWLTVGLAVFAYLLIGVVVGEDPFKMGILG